MKKKETDNQVLPASSGGSHIPPGKLHIPQQLTNPNTLKIDTEQFEQVKHIVLLTMKQTAAAINVTPQYIYKMIAEGKFPAPVKLGRMIRFRLVDLELYLESSMAEQ